MTGKVLIFMISPGGSISRENKKKLSKPCPCRILVKGIFIDL